MSVTIRYLSGILACILTSSAAGSASGLTSGAPAAFPSSYYHQAKVRGLPILHVDPAQSLVVIEVRRAGMLTRLGHDHIVSSHDLHGYVSLAEGIADLYIPLDKLHVDEPQLRIAAGFATQPSAQDIASTLHNMLTKTLDTQQFPYALIHITRADTKQPALNVTLTLHGVTRKFEVAAQIETVPNGLTIDGKLSFKQSDFGITPLSVFGGAIQVQDKLDLRFRIRAFSD